MRKFLPKPDTTHMEMDDPIQERAIEVGRDTFVVRVLHQGPRRPPRWRMCQVLAVTPKGAMKIANARFGDRAGKIEFLGEA